MDSKTRKDLLKYIVSKRRTKEGATMDEREVQWRKLEVLVGL